MEDLGRLVSLVGGTTYTVSFDARASIARSIGVSVGMNHDAFSSYSGVQTIPLGTTMAPHTFSFTYSDYPQVQKSVVLREGEKLRSIAVVFEKPVTAQPSASTALPPPKPVELHRPVPALAYALGALTFAQLLVVSVVVGAADIAFKAASGAFLKALVPREGLLVASARFDR